MFHCLSTGGLLPRVSAYSGVGLHGGVGGEVNRQGYALYWNAYLFCSSLASWSEFQVVQSGRQVIGMVKKIGK